MGQHDVTDDIVYDLVSIQYHALQAVNSYDQYLEDAKRLDDDELSAFIEECRQQDVARARRCHELLGPLTTSSS